MEIIGLQYGTIFGSHYRYVASSCMVFSNLSAFNPQFCLYGVPISVIFYWAVFIYARHSISNSFLFWQNKEKPSHKKKYTAAW